MTPFHSEENGRKGSRTCTLLLVMSKDKQEMALQAQMLKTQTRIRQTEGISCGCIAAMGFVANMMQLMLHFAKGMKSESSSHM